MFACAPPATRALLLARRFLSGGSARKSKKATAAGASADDADETHKYAHTVILPQTEFSMRADAVVREPLMQAYCCDALFEWQQRTRPLHAHPQFVLLDGPPFANGPLHVGHFLNKVLKDIVNRYKLLQGFEEAGTQLTHASSPRAMGMFLTGMGTVAMVLGTVEYWFRLQDLRKQNGFAIWRPSFVMALLMSVIGLFLFIAIIARAL